MSQDLYFNLLLPEKKNYIDRVPFKPMITLAAALSILCFQDNRQELFIVSMQSNSKENTDQGCHKNKLMLTFQPRTLYHSRNPNEIGMA